jgi:hypothetical protein
VAATAIKPGPEPPLSRFDDGADELFSDYGCHVRILEEARVLQQPGHTVTIVTYRNGRNLPDLDIRRTLPIPWRQDYEVGSSRHKVVFDALLGVKTLQLMATQRFDIIHAHLHEGALIGLVLGGLFGMPVVFDFQGSLTEEMIDHHFLRRKARSIRRCASWRSGSTTRRPLVLTSSATPNVSWWTSFGCDPAPDSSAAGLRRHDDLKPLSALHDGAGATR